MAIDIDKLLHDLTEANKPRYETSPCVNVRFKSELLARLDELVKSTGFTRSLIIKTAVERYLDLMGDNEFQ